MARNDIAYVFVTFKYRTINPRKIQVCISAKLETRKNSAKTPAKILYLVVVVISLHKSDVKLSASVFQYRPITVHFILCTCKLSSAHGLPGYDE